MIFQVAGKVLKDIGARKHRPCKGFAESHGPKFTSTAGSALKKATTRPRQRAFPWACQRGGVLPGLSAESEVLDAKVRRRWTSCQRFSSLKTPLKGGIGWRPSLIL